MPPSRSNKPLPRPDEFLDTLSQVTPADIEAAKAFVEGTLTGDLLDAKLAEQDANTSSV